jgi:hypothetical protein
VIEPRTPEPAAQSRCTLGGNRVHLVRFTKISGQQRIVSGSQLCANRVITRRSQYDNIVKLCGGHA